MALSVLDGNQSATTLSSVVTGGEHIVAHSVVSLGSNAISNITTAISGSTVCVGNLGLLQSTVATEGLTASGSFIKIGGHTGTSTTGHIVHVSAVGALRVDGSVYTQPVSIASVTIGNTVTIAGTVTANPTGTQTIAGTVTANLAPQAKGPIIQIDAAIPIDPKYVAIVGGFDTNAGESRALKLGSSGAIIVQELPAISGTVTLGASTAQIGSVTVGNTTTYSAVFVKICGERQGAGPNETTEIQTDEGGFLYARLADPSSPSAKAVIYDPVAGNAYVNVRQTSSVTIGSLPAISGTVTANGIAEDKVSGGFYAIPLSDSGEAVIVDIRAASTDLPISGTVTVGNSVTIASLPAISGTVTANTFALQGTAVTTSNFTSTTASTVLANFNATREVLTVFNEGAGLLFVCPGATCTTVQYQVRLSSGDYWEAPNHQTTITHSAVFATAGTARVTEVS